MPYAASETPSVATRAVYFLFVAYAVAPRKFVGVVLAGAVMITVGLTLMVTAMSTNTQAWGGGHSGLAYGGGSSGLKRTSQYGGGNSGLAYGGGSSGLKRTAKYGGGSSGLAYGGGNSGLRA